MSDNNSAESRNTVEVRILGETVKLSGRENAAYYQKIADYIDSKVKEIADSKRGLQTDSPLFRMLLYVNMADDLFKERDEIDRLRLELAKVSQELNEYVELLSNE